MPDGIDITDSGPPAKSLRKSDAWQNAEVLMNLAPDLMVIASTDGYFKKLNLAWPCTLGYTTQELLSTPYETFVHPDDVAPTRREVERQLQGGETLKFVNRYRHKNGSYRWLEWRAARASGDLMFATARDITDRVLAEEALQASESKYKTLVEKMNAGVFQSTLDRKFLALNAAFVRMAGYESIEDLMLKPSTCLYANTADRDRLVEMLMRDGAVRNLELQFRHKDGTTYWISLSAVLERDKTGGPAQILGIVNDISEHKRAELALRESEQRMIDITHSLGEWVWEVDEKGVYTYSSSRGENLFGNAIGKTPFDFMPPDEAQRIGPIFADIMSRSALIRDLENWNITRDGQRVCLLTNGVPILDAEGLLKGYRGVDKDITSRKQAEVERTILETQLQQAQKLESVGRLAGGVAHDFNNMLGVIIGHAEMALAQLNPDQPLYEDLTEIRQAADRSADLTRQLLAFARKQTISPRVLDLNQTITGTLRMLRKIIGEDINLNWNPIENLWPVMIDPSQIDQILTNLCVNARDALPGVGNVTIGTVNCTLDEDYCTVHPEAIPGEYIRLTVSDDGCGMDKDTLAQIFDPFFTTKDVGKGTGLGLATIYGIVKQNKGFINVYSKPGLGTAFTIYLPRHADKAEHSAEIEGMALPSKQGHETILLVEDEQSLLKPTKMLLEKQGYTVLTASMPGEAIRIAKERSSDIQLLLTDVVMPEMNGRDLARELQSLYPHIKLLFTSGYTADIIANHGILIEGVHFIQKPYAPQSLTAKIREVLDQA